MDSTNCIMAYVGMVQQIFGEVFHRANLMPTMFALCATSMGIAAFLNSKIVERFGMRRISHMALLVYLGITGLQLVDQMVRVALGALLQDRVD